MGLQVVIRRLSGGPKENAFRNFIAQSLYKISKLYDFGCIRLELPSAQQKRAYMPNFPGTHCQKINELVGLPQSPLIEKHLIHQH